jgi:hypothetical protein
MKYRNSEIIYSTNNLDSISNTFIKKYDSADVFLYYQEFLYHGKPILFVFHYNTISMTCIIDVLDIEDRTLKNIYSYKTVNLVQTDNLNNAIDVSNDIMYLAIADTIFISHDIYNRTNWSFKILPRHGYISRSFKVVGNKYFALYSDSLLNKNIYWIKFDVDSTSDTNESIIEKSDYLYSYPPFPIPATAGKVRALVFWNSGIDIETDEINIVDITGAKVSSRDKITIDKLNSYSGYLNWDCSDMQSGTYLIQIKHGTKSSTLKIMINK